MCDPTLGMVALNGISTMAGISSQNKASAANAQNAKLAANYEYQTSTEQYIEQNRSLLQGGFDAILAGREAESQAYTSAIQNGVQGNSIKAILRDQRQKTGRSATRTAQEQESLTNRTINAYKGIEQKTIARIASVPSTSFGLGDAVGILAPIVKYGSDTLGVNGLGD